MWTIKNQPKCVFRQTQQQTWPLTCPWNQRRRRPKTRWFFPTLWRKFHSTHGLFLSEHWRNPPFRTLSHVLSPFLIGQMFLREPIWFLIGQTFLREPSWKYSSKLYSGSKKLRSTCNGNIRPIRRSLPLIGWEQSSPVDEEKMKIKMDDGVARFFNHFRGNLFIYWLVGGAALSRRPRMR